VCGSGWTFDSDHQYSYVVVHAWLRSDAEPAFSTSS
jgi:hypothetical protein